MVKVLYDFDAFKLKADGVSRCMVELISHLPKEVRYEISIGVCDNIYLPSANIKTDVKPCRVNKDTFLCGKYFRGKYRLYDWIENKFSSFPTYLNINKPLSIAALKEQNFDVFHCPSTTADTYFLDYLGNKPFVLTVHDMISERLYPAGNLQSRIKKCLVPLASHIIAVSNHTKDDLMEIMGVPEEKISVIYHGAPDIKDLSASRIVKDPYFLYVGVRRGYKNFDQTLTDFSIFCKQHPECKLVATGKPFTQSELVLIRELHLENHLINFFASDEELVNLYQNAIAFVFPSLYEGFGIPILESFAYGCPALLNDTSCFPEIAADAAIYFHSRPQEQLSNLVEKMEQIYNLSEEERSGLINKGRKRAQMYSWNNSAKQLADVYMRFSSSI